MTNKLGKYNFLFFSWILKEKLICFPRNGYEACPGIYVAAVSSGLDLGNRSSNQAFAMAYHFTVLKSSDVGKT